MSWLTLPLLALDTESTGTDPESARVLSICLGSSRGPGDWTPTTLYVPTDEPIPAEATKVHGLTAEIVAERASGARPVDQLDQARAILEQAAEREIPVVGHNLRYDLTLLRAEFERMGATLPKGLHIVDTLVLFRRFDWRTGGRSLGKLAERHGITFPAHDAEADALASLRLLHILCAEHDHLPHIEPRVLTELQAVWYARQQEIAAARAAGNGTPFTPADGWPLAERKA